MKEVNLKKYHCASVFEKASMTSKTTYCLFDQVAVLLASSL